jgi:hypothetical protein
METGYPQSELNMVYFDPALARVDGRQIGATQATQALDGKCHLQSMATPMAFMTTGPRHRPAKWERS